MVYSTIPDSKENDDDSSLNSHSIPFTTDVVTITASDRHYVRVSKQILQYELKRKRINIEELMEQVHLEGDTISLPTSTTSDWPLVLQDSITTDDLRQGCISLFEQVNTDLKLTPKEVFYTVRFLEYAGIHMIYREYPHKHLLETIFPEEEKCPTKLTSALIKLVCHPSNKLRAAALSFFDVGIANSSMVFTLAMATIGLLPQLFESLKPHEIPINEATIEFHRRITSIVDRFFDCTSNANLGFLAVDLGVRTTKDELLKLVDPIFRPFCEYLRHLLAHPVCRTDYHYGLSLITKTRVFLYNIRVSRDDLLHAELQRFFQEARNIMVEEFASSLGLATKREILHELLFGKTRMTDELRWTETFERILARLSKKKQCSDWGLEAIHRFLFHRPVEVQMVFSPNGTFTIEEDGRVVSSTERPSKSLCALLTHTRHDHAASFIADIRSFTAHLSSADFLRDVQSGCFSGIFAALHPSKMPFTNDFIPLHKQLVDVMDSTLTRIERIADRDMNDRYRSELNRSYLSFHKQTRDYIVHLSLHPFDLVPHRYDKIVLDVLTKFFAPSFEIIVPKPSREKMRKEMNGSAHSSSSPPFILTSELVCRLTDEEIMKVVDRIVALLESDSPISDDTILRIITFHKMKLKSVYLPEVFRTAGRSTEQYFHAFECLLSLPFDYSTLCPFKCLLKPKPKTLQPTFDEWDDVDLLTVGVVMPTIDENRVSFDSASVQLISFAELILPQLSQCASRLTPSQLERLLKPSIDILINLFVPQFPSNPKFRRDRERTYIELSRLCEQRVIAQCLSRIGFFSRIVCGLLDDDLFFESKDVLDIFLGQTRNSSYRKPEWKTLQRTVHHFLEEGWEDVLDFLLTRMCWTYYDAMYRIDIVKDMMQFLGASFNRQIRWLYTY
ncbi:hypothetical protein BLNAU_3022 [Blattamonas nauphoetae]|uniref:Uncharacterized protein n=1 Tax=Blattamonas nauphoetae TaxID=2049346 RepID=A0ABQ9YDW2_9EUKA|nr:hypothetical protein BLNAU_3022 [Blattamonas nauphoetae]